MAKTTAFVDGWGKASMDKTAPGQGGTCGLCGSGVCGKVESLIDLAALPAGTYVFGPLWPWPSGQYRRRWPPPHYFLLRNHEIGSFPDFWENVQ